MGINFATLINMSYYDYYGDDAAATTEPTTDVYYEEVPMEMEEESESMSPVFMAFFLVPVADLFCYYSISTIDPAQDDWTMAGNIALAGGAIKLIGIVAHIAAGVKLPIAAISIVQEIASLYLVNTANGASANDSANMYMGLNAFGAVISIANVVLVKGGDDMVEEDYYYADYEEEVVPETGDDVEEYGYYGYY